MLAQRLKPGERIRSNEIHKSDTLITVSGIGVEVLCNLTRFEPVGLSGCQIRQSGSFLILLHLGFRDFVHSRQEIFWLHWLR